MTDEEEEAYALAQTLIAQAKAERWKYLQIGGVEVNDAFAGEKRAGDRRLQHLTQIPPEIAELGWLERLDIDETRISDLTPIAGLTHLQWLDLDGTQVADIGPIAGLTQLQELFLTDTPVLTAHPDLHGIHDTHSGRELVEKIQDWIRENQPPKPAPIPQQIRGGVRFRSDDEHLEPLTDGEIGPRTDAMRSIVVDALEAMSQPLPGANEFPEPARWAEDLLRLVRQDVHTINEQAFKLWFASQKFARRREADIRAENDPSGMARVMEPQMREALDNVVDSLPLFARQFSECRDLDEERADWERDLTIEPDVQTVIHEARENDVISAETAEVLDTPLPESDSPQDNKEAKSKVLTARNLIYAGLGVIATVTIGEATLGVLDGAGVRPALAQRVQTWLGGSKTAANNAMKGAPPDVQANIARRLDQIPIPTPKPPG